MITSIGLHHATSFEDPQTEILRSKTDLLRNLIPWGTAVLPRFSNRYSELLEHAKQSKNVEHILTCGTEAGDDVRLLEIVRKGELQRVTFEVSGQKNVCEVPFVGRHMVENAMLVAGVLVALDLPMSLVSHLPTSPRSHSATRRYEAAYGGKKFEIIDDCFNSGPLAVTAIVEHAAERTNVRKLLLIGDIPAMEEDSHERHVALAPKMDAAGFSHVITVGPGMKAMSEFLRTPSSSFRNRFSGANALLDAVENGDVVFIKGSSSRGFKDVLAHISKKASLTEADALWTIEGT